MAGRWLVALSLLLTELTWNAVRQHRLALIGLTIVFAGFGLRLVLTGLPLHATYSSPARRWSPAITRRARIVSRSPSR